ncbi:glycosyltransferase family 4 protein [Sulfurospirillum sp. 1307]
MNKKKKLFRITTVPISLKILLKDQLKFMNKYFDVIGISSRGKELKEIETIEGIRTIELDMSREITPIKDVISLVEMIVLICKERPDIVHTHTPKAGIIGMLASYICKVPHRLHTVAGLPVMEATGKKKKLLLFVEKLTYFCATKVYPNSKGLEEYILDNNLTKKEKLKVIGYGSSNGIDTEYFYKSDKIINKSLEIRERYDLKDKFVFLFIGRIVKDKGIDELVYSFDKLTYEFQNISLILVGNYEHDLDPISQNTKDIIKENSAIIEVGYISDIRPFIALSDCFVFPSYREGFPNVILQASSMELPCIVSNINGCNEIINHGKNGLIVKPKDKGELYLAMKQFLEDETLSKRLSKNMRDSIVKKYDRKQFFKYLLEEYEEIINA